LLRKKQGEDLDFEINEKRYHLRVEEIEVASFS
jgi:hypothetical protein